MKKHLILLAVLLFALAGLCAVAINKQAHSTKGITTAQAVRQRDDALTALNIQKQLRAVDQQAVINLTNDKKSLETNQVTLCAQIKAAKLIQPICK